MEKVCAVILAAGKSTRMISAKSKVMHSLAGRPLISYPIDVAKKACGKKVVVVRSPQQEDLKQYLLENKIEDAVQKDQLGTGDAIRAAEKNLKGFDGYVIVLCGDLPLLQAHIISSFVNAVQTKSAPVGVLTMVPEDAASYGRIVRDLDGRVLSIVEAKDASPEHLKIKEVNTGILCFKSDWLFKSLKKLKNDNAKGEYYITDLVGMALMERLPVVAYKGEPAGDFIGINTRVDLAEAASMMQARINKAHMLAGVGILDHNNTHVDADVSIGVDTEIMPYSFISGKTRIGKNCKIENGVVITDSVIGDNVHIKAHSVIEKSVILESAIVGPFARIRPESKIGKNARIGNFVELKKCEMKDGAKANHLTYLGDAVIGARSNIGCGTITCNYDGFAKYKTIVGEEVFVGSDTQFVAPVKIGRGAVIGAGSTITKDVPANALALTRCEQKTVKDWALKRNNKKKK